MLADENTILETFNIRIHGLSDIAKIFAKHINKKDLILLSGKLGVGKTEFARLILKAKATEEKLNLGEIASPTFSLIQSYEFLHEKISHIDLYRLESEAELFELGIPDIFNSQITLIEWPEILNTQNLSRYINIKILEDINLKDCRDIKFEFFGQEWDGLISALLKTKYFNNNMIDN